MISVRTYFASKTWLASVASNLLHAVSVKSRTEIRHMRTYRASWGTHIARAGRGQCGLAMIICTTNVVLMTFGFDCARIVWAIGDTTFLAVIVERASGHYFRVQSN